MLEHPNRGPNGNVKEMLRNTMEMLENIWKYIIQLIIALKLNI